MPKGDEFISSAAFAELVGISPRKAKQALQRCHAGKRWRGAQLDVHMVRGRGGHSGLQYLVRLDSIPMGATECDEIGTAIDTPDATRSCQEADSPPAKENRSHAARSGRVYSDNECGKSTEPDIINTISAPKSGMFVGDMIDNDVSAWRNPYAASSCHADAYVWRHALIRPALAHPRGSAERSAAVTVIAQTARYQSGKRLGQPVAERTLYAWIAEYETKGFAGLMRKARADRGQRRVVLSTKWDALADAAGLSEAEQQRIADATRRHIASQWRSGAPTWPTVQLNCLPFVMAMTREAGCGAPDDELRAACMLPRDLIEAERRFQAVAIRRKDAGRSAAIQTPRVHRDRSHLRPMDWVAGDVHHIDIAFRRDDGSLCTVKAVAWLELATNRAFVSLFIMPKGQMIRREHVIQSFVDMCTDPNWGVPSRLYVDNGGEYNWGDFIADLTKLKHTIEVRDRSDLGADTGMTRSRAYNPQSKVIESLFAMLERSCLAQIPGHMGGDRMKKKTENQGREPVPYPGTFDDFKTSFANALEYYHCKAQKGHLSGQSPRDRFGAFVNDGWRSLLLDPAELAVAFSTEETRKVRAGGEFTWDGKLYRHDALLALAGTGTVLVRAPLFGDREALFIFDEFGQPLGVARPVPVFAFGDIKGAGEQQRMTAELNRQIRAMEGATDRIDLEQSMAGAVAAFGPAPVAVPDGMASIRPEYREAARLSRALPTADDKPARPRGADVRRMILEREERMRAAG